MGKLCELEGCTRLEPVGTARRMAAANGAKRRAAPSQLETTRGTVWRMAEAGGASTRAAPRQLLQATRSTAARMAEVNGASKRAAPSQLLQATRSTAAPARMEGQTVPARGLPQASRESSSSVFCTLCLRGTQPQPDGAEAHEPPARELTLSLREREAIQRLVEDFA